MGASLFKRYTLSRLCVSNDCPEKTGIHIFGQSFHRRCLCQNLSKLCHLWEFVKTFSSYSQKVSIPALSPTLQRDFTLTTMMSELSRELLHTVKTTGPVVRSLYIDE